MNNGTFSEFEASHYAGATVVLPNTVLLKLQWQGPRIFLRSCFSHLTHLLLKSLRPRQLCSTCNPVTDAFQVAWIALVRQTRFLHTTLLDTRVEVKFHTLHNDTAAISEDPVLIGPIGPALPAFPQQVCVPRSHMRSSSEMLSMFSSQFPSATRRGMLSVSDMSNKNSDPMESIWDLGPMIWRIKTRRRPCRRRSRKGLLKSALFALWTSTSLVPSVCCPKITFLWVEEDVCKPVKRPSTDHFNWASSKKFALEFGELMAMYFWWRAPLSTGSFMACRRWWRECTFTGAHMRCNGSHLFSSRLLTCWFHSQSARDLVNYKQWVDLDTVLTLMTCQ